MNGRIPYVKMWLDETALKWEGDECIFFPFPVSSSGYGLVCINYRRVGAHVYVCEKAIGAKPGREFEVAHSCGNKLCVNKRHLRWDTRTGNNADKKLHGTYLRGETAANSKLTTEQVVAIRNANGSQREIARAFGISASQVSRIKHGKDWSHV